MVPKFIKSTKNGLIWKAARDVRQNFLALDKKLKFSWIVKANVYFLRSQNAKTNAYARIWGLGRVWQLVLQEKPSYIVEVISEKYDRLAQRDKDAVLLHEISHIPKNFSGSLVPHYHRGKRNFHKKVRDLINSLNLK